VSLQPGMIRPALVTRDQVFLAAKTAIAAGLAWVAALAADPHSRPYFAPLAVLLVVQPTVYGSLSRAFRRVAGVVVGVAAALAVSRVLAPSAWSIGLIIFVGLLVGWTARLGPQGVVQVPVSALLVILLGHTTPGYAGERIADTLIGAGIAVIAVLLSPSAPAPGAVMSHALAPLQRCTEILQSVSTGIASTWTTGQADSWRHDAATLIDSIATARSEHEGLQLSTRWNARAHRQRAALGQAEEAIRSGERIAIYIRSMTRARRRIGPGPSDVGSQRDAGQHGVGHRRLRRVAGLRRTPADRRRLAETVHAADDALTSALTRVQERWGSDPAQWLTFGTTLAMSQRILAEVGRPIDPAEREPA
jgi:uncharacterized membrane protein YgaE (UPF0421/DUF939 family)